MNGIYFDTIEETSEFIPDAMEHNKFLLLLDIIYHLEDQRLTGLDRLDVFLRTIVADRIDESGTDYNKAHFSPEKVGESYLAWLMNHMARSIIIGHQTPGDWIADPGFMIFRGVSLLDSGSDQDTSISFDAFLAEYLSLFDPEQDLQTEAFTTRFINPTLLYTSMYDKSIWIRRLARTRTTNRLCLIAPSVEPGDQIWYLQGAKVPFILRKLPSSKYILRGEAFVQGCMDGEVFSHFGFSTDDSATVEIE